MDENETNVQETVIAPTETQGTSTNEVEITVEQLTTLVKSNPAVLKDVLKEDFAQPYLQPHKDAHFTKGLKTWQENNLDSIVNAKLAELNPAETAEQKQLRELQQQLNQMANQNKQKELELTKVGILSEVGLGNEFSKFVVGDSEEGLRQSATEFRQLLDTAIKINVDEQVNERFKSATIKPNADLPVTGGSKDFASMTYAERDALYRQNPAQYQQLKTASINKTLKN